MSHAEHTLCEDTLGRRDVVTARALDRLADRQRERLEARLGTVSKRGATGQPVDVRAASSRERLTHM